MIHVTFDDTALELANYTTALHSAVSVPKPRDMHESIVFYDTGVGVVVVNIDDTPENVAIVLDIFPGDHIEKEDYLSLKEAYLASL